MTYYILYYINIRRVFVNLQNYTQTETIKIDCVRTSLHLLNNVGETKCFFASALEYFSYSSQTHSCLHQMHLFNLCKHLTDVHVQSNAVRGTFVTTAPLPGRMHHMLRKL